MSTSMNDASLFSYLDSYRARRKIADDSAVTMRATIGSFGKHLGREATVSDLNEATVSGFFWWLDTASEYAPATRYSRQTDLLAIWRDAHSAKLAERPGSSYRIKKWQPSPSDVWTVDEAQQVLDACSGLLGLLESGASAAAYFQALYFAAYETGLPRASLWALRRDQIGTGGRVWILPRKTARAGVPRLCKISEATATLLESLPGELPLSWQQSERLFYACASEIAELARVKNGALSALRRAGATRLYDGDPTDAQRYLGHTTHQMWRHHVDASRQQSPPWELPESSPIAQPLNAEGAIQRYAENAVASFGLPKSIAASAMGQAVRILTGDNCHPEQALPLLCENASRQPVGLTHENKYVVRLDRPARMGIAICVKELFTRAAFSIAQSPA